MELPPLPPTHFPPTHSPRRSQSSATKQSGWQVRSIITSSFYYCLQGLSNEDKKLSLKYTCCAGPIISPAKPVSSCSSHPSRNYEPFSPAPRPPRCLAPEKKTQFTIIHNIQHFSAPLVDLIYLSNLQSLVV